MDVSVMVVFWFQSDAWTRYLPFDVTVRIWMYEGRL